MIQSFESLTRVELTVSCISTTDVLRGLRCLMRLYEPRSQKRSTPKALMQSLLTKVPQHLVILKKRNVRITTPQATAEWQGATQENQGQNPETGQQREILPRKNIKRQPCLERNTDGAYLRRRLQAAAPKQVKAPSAPRRKEQDWRLTPLHPKYYQPSVGISLLIRGQEGGGINSF